MKIYLILISVLFLTSCSEKRTEIILNADNVGGLTTEANITLNGFKIGEIEDMKITPNGTIDIICNLTSETKIPSDSKFKIQNLDLLGSKGIIVELGESSEYLKNGDIMQLTKIESNNLGDSLGVKVVDFFKSLTGTKKQDSILIELRRLNENLEKQNK